MTTTTGVPANADFATLQRLAPGSATRRPAGDVGGEAAIAQLLGTGQGGFPAELFGLQGPGSLFNPGGVDLLSQLQEQQALAQILGINRNPLLGNSLLNQAPFLGSSQGWLQPGANVFGMNPLNASQMGVLRSITQFTSVLEGLGNQGLTGLAGLGGLPGGAGGGGADANLQTLNQLGLLTGLDTGKLDLGGLDLAKLLQGNGAGKAEGGEGAKPAEEKQAPEPGTKPAAN